MSCTIRARQTDKQTDRLTERKSTGSKKRKEKLVHFFW